ncbi:MAG: class I SAM-dependent methyltransferase [Flavobacteriales bacterium]|nr:class I SAM-dependent methyltransferase [Flavobacteriales bacterium]
MKRTLRSSLLRLTKYLSLPHKVKWKVGALDEIAFWDDHIAKYYASTDGVPKDANARFRVDPSAPLQKELADLLTDVRDPVVRLLDVGAGPFSRMGKTLAGHTVELTAVDPLTTAYARLYEKHNVFPPVRPMEGRGEDLRSLFPADHFHLAHANNCLDHGYDPIRSVQQMVEVVRPGGHVYLRHEVNVAQGAGYMGMHQWNFHLDDQGNFTISDKHRSVDMVRLLGPDVTVTSRTEGLFLITVIHKHDQRIN